MQAWLPAAARAVEACQPVFHRVGAHAQADGGSRGGQGIFHIMHPGHMQGHVRKKTALIHDIKLGVCPYIADIFRVHIRRRAEAEGDKLPVHAPDGVHGVPVVMICYHISILRDAGGKGSERMLHILKIPEEVQMIRLHIEDNGHRGVQGQERVVILAGLHDDGVPVAHPVPGVEQRQGAAYHNGGIPVGGHENVGAHGGGRGLAVSAGDAERVGVIL